MICKYQNVFLFLVIVLCFIAVLCEESEEVEKVVAGEKVLRGESVHFNVEPILAKHQNGLIIEALADDDTADVDNGKLAASGESTVTDNSTVSSNLTVSSNSTVNDNLNDNKKSNGNDNLNDNKKSNGDDVSGKSNCNDNLNDNKKSNGDNVKKEKRVLAPLFEKNLDIEVDENVFVTTAAVDSLVTLVRNFVYWKADLFNTLLSALSPCAKKGERYMLVPVDDTNGQGNVTSDRIAQKDCKKSGSDVDLSKGPSGEPSNLGRLRRLEGTEEEATEEKESNDVATIQARFDLGIARGNANIGFGTVEAFINKLNKLVNASVEGPKAFRKTFYELFRTDVAVGSTYGYDNDENAYDNDNDNDNDDEDEDENEEKKQLNALRETVLSSLQQDFQLLRVLLPTRNN